VARTPKRLVGPALIEQAQRQFILSLRLQKRLSGISIFQILVLLLLPTPSLSEQMRLELVSFKLFQFLLRLLE